MAITNPIILKLITHIESECSAVNQEEVYDSMLDEAFSFESVGGPFEYMQPSHVLREMDPTAYRCGMNDYFGTDDSYVEVGAELYVQHEVEKARESFVEDLESELADLETEIEDLEADENRDEAELAKLKGKAEGLKAEIEACERHSF